MREKDTTGKTKKFVAKEQGLAMSACAAYSIERFAAYWVGQLSADKMDEIDTHAENCPECLERKREAYIDFKTDQVCSQSHQDEMYAIAARKIENLSTTARQTRTWPAEVLAASLPAVGSQGEALGVAVSIDGSSGRLVECNAWVGAKDKTAGKLEIWGMQVEEDSSGVKITRPLDYLEHKLEGIFQVNPLLQAYSLDRRNISVDLKERIFQEANSLCLAIIMAVLNAIHREGEASNVVYSADIRQDGRLERVGDPLAKIETAILNGAETIVFSNENRPDFSDRQVKSEEIEILFFETLGECLENIGGERLVPSGQISVSYQGMTNELKGKYPDSAPAGKTEFPQVQDAADPLEYILKKLEPAGIKESRLRMFFERFEDFCQFRRLNRTFSTALLLGNQDALYSILPPAGLDIKGEMTVLELFENFRELASIVDGVDAAFIIDQEGRLDSIRRVNIGTLRTDLNPLLEKENKRYANLSGVVDAIVFFFPPTGRQLHLFYKGAMIGKYISGRWQATDYALVEGLLRSISERDALSREAVMRITRVAITMAEQGKGATFLFTRETESLPDLIEDRFREYLGLSLKPTALSELRNSEIEKRADADGAVIIDAQGVVLACGSYFNTTISRPKPGMSMRHEHARLFSRDISGFAVVAGRYGTVTFYRNGNKLMTI